MAHDYHTLIYMCTCAHMCSIYVYVCCVDGGKKKDNRSVDRRIDDDDVEVERAGVEV